LPVEEHQDPDRRKGGADPTDVGDQDGRDPLSDDSHQSEHSERDQGKERQDDEQTELGVEREELDHGAKELIGVGHDRNGVTLGWAELVVRSALPWQLPLGLPSPDIPDVTVGRGDALLPHDRSLLCALAGVSAINEASSRVRNAGMLRVPNRRSAGCPKARS
jgi:hypothetical protein